MSNQVVREPVNCKTAEQFLTVLSPIGEYFKNEKHSTNWLFRGQGQDYQLKPSLFRTDPPSIKKLKELTKYNIEDYSQLIKAELDFLIQFFEIADKRGLVLPDDSQDFRSGLEVLRQYRKDNNYKIDHDRWVMLTKTLSLMALAQHYGVPTRLLDWTRKSDIAVFFAAEDAYKHKYDPSSNLVVWAFCFPNFDRQKKHKSDDLFDIWGVTAPSATNANLKAQQGVFTLLDFRFTDESQGNCLPFDSLLENLTAKTKTANPSLEWGLQKFTLPVSETEKLLLLLAKMDIASSSVYPGYGSIISDLQMRRSFEEL